ncbi:hypothetical protein QFC21_006963 [Naganishia friedmannii]|uniref:Uncharacterized protein n=1 Tax=Naganishia friedmannii TaxID=89922 RepID=A0ACC2UZ23_9TREE|nr:hypothetical protein QFC21_006963 [Naganishia friedmannii]
MATFREIKAALKEPITQLSDLEHYLSTITDLVHPHGSSYSSGTGPENSKSSGSFEKNVAAIQALLLENVLPTWSAVIEQEESVKRLLQECFSPLRTTSDGGTNTNEQKLLATVYSSYQNLSLALHNPATSPQLYPLLISLTATLVDRYSIRDLWRYARPSTSSSGDSGDYVWEQSVKLVIALPARVMNAYGRAREAGVQAVEVEEVDRLSGQAYFDQFVRDLEQLFVETSQSYIEQELPASDIGALAWSFLLHLSKGIHTSTTPNRNIKQAAEYFERFLGPPVEPSSKSKGKQKAGSRSISAQRTTEIWDSVLETLLMRGKGRESGSEETVEIRCRIIVCWAAKGGDIDISQLLLLALSRLPPYHPYLQQLSFQPSFLASMQAYLSHSDSSMRRLGMLVAEVLSELTIPDTSDDSSSQGETNRKNGKEKDAEVEELEKMLQSLGDGDGDSNAQRDAPPSKQRRRLQFGKEIWDGFGQGKEECRRLRTLVGLRDEAAKVEDEAAQNQEDTSEKGDWTLLGWNTTDEAGPTLQIPEYQKKTQQRGRPPSPKADTSRPKARPKEPDSDDESMSGYSSSGNSSRSPSPTQSYLDEIANDPMANTSMKAKIQRPVYIIQLIELLRAREEPDKLEVGLKWGESLIRRKRHFGKELEENSIFLCQVLCALSDPYDLAEFEERRQSMLTALTACVPKRVAPYLIEQYFAGQYSLMQRSAILTALSMAARETAGFSSLPRPDIPKKIDFPSKVLPMALHDRYVTEQDLRNTANAGLLLQAGKDHVVGSVLSKKRDSTNGKAVQTRQRQLRPAHTANKSGQHSAGLNAISEDSTAPIIPFRDVAAEYFILPMINRFWTYFQDEMARESRSYGRRGVGTGTGMILSPMAMSHFLSALTIMLHAARHSPAFLAVIAPDALELAIAMGTQLAGNVNIASGLEYEDQTASLEADVVAAALELALVCLDGSRELDGGKSLARDHLPSVMAVAEWAEGIFAKEKKGESASAHKGGKREDRMQHQSGGNFDSAEVGSQHGDIIESIEEYVLTDTGVQGLSIDGGVGSAVESQDVGACYNIENCRSLSTSLKSPSVEPHGLIKKFEEKFYNAVQCHLKKVQPDVTSVPSDLQEVCKKLKTVLAGHLGLDKDVVKEQLLLAMDSEDGTFGLWSRAEEVRKKLSSCLMKKDFAKWQGLLNDLRTAVAGVNQQDMSQSSSDFDFEKYREKQNGHIERLAAEVQQNLKLLQMWNAEEDSVQGMFEQLKAQAGLHPGDIYPLKLASRHSTGARGKTEEHTGSYRSGSVSYGTPSDGRTDNYYINEGVQGSHAAESVYVLESRRSSLPNAPSVLGRRPPSDEPAPGQRSTSDDSMARRRRSIQRIQLTAEQLDLEPWKKLTIDQQLAGIDVENRWPDVPSGPALTIDFNEERMTDGGTTGASINTNFLTVPEFAPSNTIASKRARSPSEASGPTSGASSRGPPAKRAAVDGG